MKKRRHVAIFIAFLFLVSIITGFIYALNNPYDLDNYLKTLNNHNNLFLYHYFVILIFLIGTLSIIGVILEIFIMGFESVSIGYIIGLFVSKYKVKGLIYAILSIIINKGLYILLLSYLILTSYIYLEKSIKNLLGLNKDYFKNIVIPVFKKYLIIFIFMTIFDIFIYFFGNILLKYLTFML